MPIFEFVCVDCNERFETLVRGEEKVHCPACRSRRLEKQLSVFSANTNAGSSKREFAPSPCGSCGDPRGPGSCSLN